MRNLTKDELIATGQMLCLRIASITGWTLPNENLEILFDQLAKYLVEMFPTLNHEEIEYAFRTKSSNVKDWGKNLNLSLFTEVLEPYLIERKAASEKEAQQAAKLDLEKNIIPQKKMDNKELIETAYKIWQGMKNWEFIMVGAWQAIKEEKLFPLTKDEQHYYLSAAWAISVQKEEKDPDFFFNIDKESWLRYTAGKLATNKYFESLKKDI
jgi:hypothetical protein